MKVTLRRDLGEWKSQKLELCVEGMATLFCIPDKVNEIEVVATPAEGRRPNHAYLMEVGKKDICVRAKKDGPIVAMNAGSVDGEVYISYGWQSKQIRRILGQGNFYFWVNLPVDDGPK